VAVVSFSDTVTVDQPLTGNFAAARAQIDNLQAEGYTHTGDGLAAAWAHLEAVKREDTTPVILLFADGVNTGGANPQTVAADIKSQGVRIFVIGLSCKRLLPPAITITPLRLRSWWTSTARWR
jgi:Mg-chelatase subunit ChlD